MRLIDAEKTIEEIRKLADGLDEKKHIALLGVTGLINEQPTAYDVDKVMEELEEASNDIPIQYENNYEQGVSNGIEKAIKIVKHGVISDDVCEWKYNDTEYYWESSCDHLHIFMSDGPKENEYDFCPYCGKKIKVVE